MTQSKTPPSSAKHQRKAATHENDSISRDISIWLDKYDDLFSDFDPRELSERTLSDDFVHEIRKLTYEDESHVGHLKLLLPESVRNKDSEEIITKRIHLHFKKHLQRLLQNRKTFKQRGILFTLLGTSMLIGASYFSYQKYDHFLMHIPLVFLEPGGWFLMWTGLDNLISINKKSSPDLIFHNKIANTKIVFGSI